MKKEALNKKIIVLIIITLFLTTSLIPNISGNNTESNNDLRINTKEQNNNQDDVAVTCYNFGMPGKSSKESTMTLEDAEFLYNKIKSLQIETAVDPFSQETQNLQYEIIQLADKHNLLPYGVSVEILKSHFNQDTYTQKQNKLTLPFLQSSGREFLCTFVSAGSGGLLPILVLPRFIPIIMTPIPRIFMIWRANEAVTSCGGLRSGTGFIAYGEQKGLALGFWGIGFTFSLPPVMGVFGLAGYALFSSVDAEYIEFYPPNSPPVISQIDPGDGEVNVPLSLSELRFQIMDLDGDLMSYTVTTSPDIGSGSGNLVSDGIYSVDVSGLEDLTEYTWHVEVTDGMDITVGDYSFITEPIAPIVSNPIPYDGARYVSIDLSELSFYLKDYQGDPIDYTVETVPNIGSGGGSGVGEGTYSISVIGLDFSTQYLWFVNATDGVHESRKVFGFQVEHEMTFDPFSSGWLYRKEVTIDHGFVDGDLENFPVLISCVDVDLRDKAQGNGDDILFMDGVGVADRLFHEIEDFVGGSGKLVAWVNIPYLDSGSDTVFYMYYGNSECDCQQAPEFVWDSYYEAVWHMGDKTILTISDSTFNHNSGNKKSSNNPLEVEVGKIGLAQDFERDTYSFIDAGGTYAVGEDDEITLSGWVYVESYENQERPVIMSTMDGSTAQYVNMRVMEPDSPFACKGGFWCDDGTIPSPDTFTDNLLSEYTWYYICGVLDRSIDEMYIYKNGVKQTDVHDMSGIGSCDDGTNIFLIGVEDPDCGYRGYWDGILDELRVSNIPRSPSWISTEFNNQNDPSSFYFIGPEEP